MTRKQFWIGISAGVTLAAAGVAALILINLVPDRREMRSPVHSAVQGSQEEFARGIEGLFGSSIMKGNHIDTLRNGDEIFPAMLDAIVSAQTSINFETYIYWSGAIGQAFADALSARARAGVEVRVLMDWIGSLGIEQSLLDQMTEAGVQTTLFRPPRWYNLGRMNNRTHRKLLIVDGHTGFTGGVGIGDQWQGDARHPNEYRENHYRITGPIVGPMQGAFALNWVEATGELLQGEQHFPMLETTGDLRTQLVTSATGTRNYLHLMKLLVMSGAQSHIRIATPYFIPDDVTLAQLRAARERGVSVEVLVPNRFIDLNLARYASRFFWGDLLDAGVEFYEYQPTFLHKKLLIVDDRITIIGSSNFDERSFRLNDEANLNVFDEEFARLHISIFEDDKALSRRFSWADWENRSAWTRLKDWFWARWRVLL